MKTTKRTERNEMTQSTNESNTPTIEQEEYHFLTEEQSGEIASRVGLEIAEANQENYDANFVIPYVDKLLSQAVEAERSRVVEAIEKKWDEDGMEELNYKSFLEVVESLKKETR